MERVEGVLQDHALELDVEGGIRAWGDPVLVDRVLENLLTNAAKHTPAGTTVRVSARNEGDEVMVSVADDGPGVPESEVSHLTERFFRGGDINTRPRGLGLGLALVREMLELQGTELAIETSEGLGSRFVFRLQRADPPDGDGAGAGQRSARAVGGRA